ncbi:MAG: CDP-diacylglycerol--glycerol-3-phosphate 3-phosphatidyltransferase [Gemmataceae bacterium]|nr:CDP-diacylglycerol--glycerol-3-phosphate 3-phosphatidyltransferase [Gemmataceae bacterium]
MNYHHYLRLIPNGLSASRVVLGLAFPWLPPDWRFAVVGLAAVTDFLDGLLARWLGAQSETGRLLDPVADKVFILMLAGTLVGEGVLGPGWAVAVAARDVVVLAGVAVLAARGDRAGFRAMRPTWLGKCTTAAQFALFLVLVAEGRSWDWLLWVTAGLSVVAAAAYARAFGTIRRGGPTVPGA